MNYSEITNPLVSIVIPVYNGEKWLERTFACLMDLKYDNIEIIFVDDASTDNSYFLLKDFVKRDARVKFISNEINLGPGKSRNKAIKEAKGKYFFMFDQDDTFDVNIVNHCVFCAETTNADAVLYVVDSINSNGEVIKHNFTYEKDTYVGEDVFKVAEKSFGISLEELYDYIGGKRGARDGKERSGPYRMMYRREVICKNNLGFPERITVGEDTVFTNEYICFCEKVQILRESLYFAHINETSTTHKYAKDWKKMADNKIKVLEEKENMIKRVSEKSGGYDLSNSTNGQCILSTVQLMVAASIDNSSCFKEKIVLLKKFFNNPHVKKYWEKVQLERLLSNLTIKAVPVILLKCRMVSLVLILMSIMSKFGIAISE